MILLDERAGSSALMPYIKQLTSNVTLTRLEFGDIAWVGEGPDSRPTRIGIEYKRIDDVMTCMIDGRFSGHQLPGLLISYDRVWLVVEGNYREEPITGILQKWDGHHKVWVDIVRGRRGFLRRELDHWFMTMENQAGIRVKEFSDANYGTVAAMKWVVRAHSWWTARTWDEHKSLHQFHIPPPPAAPIIRHGLLRRWAKELTGVGWERSAAVAAMFKSPREMACANEKQWKEVDGIGDVLSRRIVMEITRENGG